MCTDALCSPSCSVPAAESGTADSGGACLLGLTVTVDGHLTVFVRGNVS